eukprot:SAG22_NODE_14898_length_362_cov_0.787072_1_plen_57_part_01
MVEPVEGGNFRCGGDTDWPAALAEAELLWHWSRRPGLSRAPSTFSLPPEAGLLLPSK